MIKVAASLAAVVSLAALAGCGNGGAEPGASREATLVLDFQPNAAHAGIYAALAQGEYAARGLELTVRAPSTSTDAPKLLAAGRADAAILDIHDLALARERGVDIVGVGALVDRPLAAVIAADRAEVRRPGALEGESVGVTGLPSDDAVLASVLEADGADPARVERVTIGFEAVTALVSGRLKAATAFWNAEGVQLRELGLETREFRVDRYGAPRYPELIVCTSRETAAEEPELVAALTEATARGNRAAAADPPAALDALAEAEPLIDREAQASQLDALLRARALAEEPGLERRTLERWARWDLEQGIVTRPIDLDLAFPTG